MWMGDGAGDAALGVDGVCAGGGAETPRRGVGPMVGHTGRRRHVHLDGGAGGAAVARLTHLRLVAGHGAALGGVGARAAGLLRAEVGVAGAVGQLGMGHGGRGRGGRGRGHALLAGCGVAGGGHAMQLGDGGGAGVGGGGGAGRLAGGAGVGRGGALLHLALPHQLALVALAPLRLLLLALLVPLLLLLALLALRLGVHQHDEVVPPRVAALEAQEWVQQQLARTEAQLLFLEAQLHEEAHLAVLDAAEHVRLLPRADALPYLRCVAALLERVLLGGHLQHAHAEGVHVHRLAVVLVVQLGRHELGRAQHRLHVGGVPGDGEAEVADAHLTRRAVDEDVVALQVAVDDGRRVGVQVVQGRQYLAAPAGHNEEGRHGTTVSDCREEERRRIGCGWWLWFARRWLLLPATRHNLPSVTPRLSGALRPSLHLDAKTRGGWGDGGGVCQPVSVRVLPRPFLDDFELDVLHP